MNDTYHILLIDDSREDAMMIERIIRKHPAKPKFTWIGDAEDGLAYLSASPAPEHLLILIDIKMPKLTGLELIEELAKTKKLSYLRNVTVYSSSDLKRDVDRALQHEGVEFNTKPNGYLEAKSWLTDKITNLISKAANN